VGEGRSAKALSVLIRGHWVRRFSGGGGGSVGEGVVQWEGEISKSMVSLDQGSLG